MFEGAAGNRMNRYLLEIAAPRLPGAPSENANRLTFALESLAMIHGGKLVESPDASVETGYRHRSVDILSCESSLESEVEWLRREFPDAKFTLRRSIQDQSRQGQEDSVSIKEP
jgi:hypothetical protein